MNPRNVSELYPFAIYAIYAVAIGFSFTTAGSVLMPIERAFTSFNGAFNALALSLAYVVTISGLIGYSKSIAARPHSDNKLGNLRFVVDLSIMFLVYYLISLTDPTPIDATSYARFDYYEDTFTWVFPAIFGAYFAWDIIKYYEYKNVHQSEAKTNIQRGTKTLYFLLLFIIQSILYVHVVTPHYYSSLTWDGQNAWPIVFIFTSGGLVVGYRYSKWHVPRVKKIRAKQGSARVVTKTQ